MNSLRNDLLGLLCASLIACTQGQPSTTAQSSQKPSIASTPPAPAAPPKRQADEAEQAALSATGDEYPAPALFVKRWNILAKARPQTQITAFTSLGHENTPRPVAELDGFDTQRAERTYLQIGTMGLSVDYVTIRDDPMNLGGTEHPNLYAITFGGKQREFFADYCVWMIRSAKTSFSDLSAAQMLKRAVDYVPPSHSTDPRKHAEGDGVQVALWTGDDAMCEIKAAGSSRR